MSDQAASPAQFRPALRAFAGAPALRLPDHAALLGLALLAAGLSLLRSGLSFNRNNNAFHLPIVLRFETLPQFADDPFVLSLPGFVTPVFPLLASVATEANVQAIFLGGVVLVHVLTLFALLRIGQALGLARRSDLALLALAIVAARTSYWGSPVGGDGMLVGAFSHSELARAFALLAIAMLLEGRGRVAGAFAGAALTVNVAFGVWLAWLFGGVLLPPAWRRARAAGWRAGLGVLGPPVLAFAAVAAPGALWILARAELGARPDFDYVAFLRDYYPRHFFIGPSLGWPLAQVLSALLALPLAAGLLAQPGRLRRLAWALAGLFGLGALVGEVSASRLLLQLHFLRSDGIILLLATVAAAAALLRAARQGGVAGPVAGGLGALGLLLGAWPLVVLALLLARGGAAAAWLERRVPARAGAWIAAPAGRRMLAGGMVGLAVAAILGAYAARTTPPRGVPQDIHLLGSAAIVPDWLAVQRWAREQTSPMAVFLLPASISDDFRVGARRRIWVGMKDGATAMWSPATYRQWRDRADDILRIGQDVPRLHAYACPRGIGYIVLDLRPQAGRPTGSPRVVYRNAWFEVQRADCGP